MNRSFFLASLVALCLPLWQNVIPVSAQEQTAEPQSVEQRLKADPNSTATLNEYMIGQIRQLVPQINSAPDEAQKILDSMKTTLDALEPTEEPAKQLLGKAKDAVDFYAKQLELARTSLDDLRTKLSDNPDDASTIGMFIQKVMQQAGPLAGSKPAEAEEQLTAADAFLEGLKEKVQTEEAKQALAVKERAFGQLRSAIERTKRLEAIVGTEAAPLNVETWVNGDPLTDDDLKGKVVLLDFWAIWCGPCIMTFPHLREWQEEYADKGLVIIGLTNYYNYVWSEEAARPTRSQEKVTPEQEQEMLKKFAEHHKLQHRFAIQKDKSLAEFYGVSGIPHVVVIDREGKVQLMRIGSGEEAAKAIEAKIEELIAKGA